MMSQIGLTRAQVEAYISRFESARIRVLGDIMLDRYFWGEVERISPEAPVPVVRVSRKSARLGGAANVAANLRSLGVGVELAGVVGDDRAGSEVVELLQAQGIDTAAVEVREGGETTEKVRIIAQNQQVVRADFEHGGDARKRRATVKSNLRRQVKECDALVISDYGKGVIHRDGLCEVIEAWRAGGKPVLVDPFVRHFRWYSGASIVTPNTREAASFFDAATGREELFSRLGFRIRDELSLDALLITRGEEGMSLFLGGNEQVQIPTVAKEVYDVTGAGDTVISVLAAAMACGVPLVEAVVVANQAAGEVVKEIGTTAITASSLLNSFS
ncbi:MAG: D-glycero-beta-D-manno-heptose-7-phosphate kinase [Candidatus Krumholzibacteriia bacterium]